MAAVSNDPRTFAEVRARLDEILAEVRSKDVSLEKSLDLYEEAVRLGAIASDMVDKAQYSPDEEETLRVLSQIPSDEEDQAEAAQVAAEGE